MVLKEKDHLKKVRCKIESTVIEEGLIYYSKSENKFFILQNKKDGSVPDGWNKIIKETGYLYKYSWVCQKQGRNLESLDIRNLKFVKQENIYELWV